LAEAGNLNMFIRSVQMKKFCFAAAFVVLGAIPAVAADVEGSTSAIFNNPTPMTPGTVTTGVGTSAFTYGVGSPPPPNLLNFAGASSFSSSFDTPFSVGTLT